MSLAGSIGLFDSGMGGLSVMREVRCLLPAEDLAYFADSAYCPYGCKPEEMVRQRTFHIADFLLAQGAKLLVVACNTASIAALDALRARCPEVPIVGMEPAVKPAAAVTRSGRIGVLATTVTLHGERFASLRRRFAQGVEVFTLPGIDLVERVEAGHVDTPDTVAWLRQLLAPLQEARVDTLVLGSTHYPFLRPAIERIMGPQVPVIDTGQAVARRTQHLLEERGLANLDGRAGQETFYTSGDPAAVGPVLARLWGQLAPVQYHD
jgi:glutamate racemase